MIPLYLHTDQWAMLAIIARLPESYFTPQTANDARQLDALVTLRLARERVKDGVTRYRVTVFGMSELRARGE